jgi:sulfur-oxidizing protein SoxY
MTRRAALRSLAILATLLVATVPVAGARAADPELETAQWTEVRKTLFGERPIQEAAEGVIQLDVPLRPDSGALVPVRITTKGPQSAERFVKRIVLVIDRNPEPLAATFHLTPESGRAELTTYMRVETHSPMRAIAELSDGQLFMAARMVKASGGCGAAPMQLVASADLGKVKIKTQDAVVVNEPNWALISINHPNHTGFQVHPLKMYPISAHFVTKVRVSYAGKPVLVAETTIASSEDPNFRFYFTPKGPGELKVEAEDSRGGTFGGAVEVKP